MKSFRIEVRDDIQVGILIEIHINEVMPHKHDVWVTLLVESSKLISFGIPAYNF